MSIFTDLDPLKKAQLAARTAAVLLLLLLGLFAVQGLIIWVSMPETQSADAAGRSPWPILVFGLALCPFVRGLWCYRTRTALLLCLVLSVYFMGFLVSVISFGDRGWHLVYLLLVICLASLSMLFINWRNAV